MAIRARLWPMIATSIMPADYPEHIRVCSVMYVGDKERWRKWQDFAISTPLAELERHVVAMQAEAFARLATELCIGA